MSTVDRINDQSGNHDQPHALSDAAETLREVCRECISRKIPRAVVPPEELLAILDAHANDLADMQRAVSQIEEVYYHITGGQLSKWQTDPVHIKQAHDDACEQAAKDEREDVVAEFEALAVDLVERTRKPSQWGGTVIDGQAWTDAEAVKALAAKLRRNTAEAQDEKEGA